MRLMSSPFSFMKARVRGSIARGSSPALEKMNLGWPSDCAIASAIWLRQALCSPTKRMRKVSAPGCLAYSPVHM